MGDSANIFPTISVPFLGKVRIKYVALCLLVAQTVGAIVLMRVSRLSTAADGFKYINTTAVVMSEAFKLLGSLFFVWNDSEYSIVDVGRQLHTNIIQRPWETVKVGIPAFLYTVQNNLIFVALSNMSPALYQVTYQMKILTTAVLSVIMLNRRLSMDKWITLILLTVGVASIQIPSGNASAKPVEGNVVIGLLAVVAACFTSGFAGVYFEKILKGTPVSIWLRNIQLAIFGTIIGLIGVWWNDGDAVASNGFFQGYTSMTWAVVLLQSAGGLIVAAVLKYADNILKCFGNALAIILSCLFSYILLNELDVTIFFFFGTILVVTATYAYGTEMSLTAFLPRAVISPFNLKRSEGSVGDERGAEEFSSLRSDDETSAIGTTTNRRLSIEMVDASSSQNEVSSSPSECFPKFSDDVRLLCAQ